MNSILLMSLSEIIGTTVAYGSLALMVFWGLSSIPKSWGPKTNK